MRYEAALRYAAQHWPHLAGWIEHKVGKHNDYNFSARGRVNNDLQVVGLGKDRRQLVQTLILVWIALGRDKCKSKYPDLHLACRQLKEGADATYYKYDNNYIRAFLQDYNTKLSKYSKPVFHDRPKLILKGEVSGKHEKLDAAMDKLPTAKEWKNMTPPDIRAGCPSQLLAYVDECLAEYASVHDYDAAANWDRLAALGNLYFACDMFLKEEEKRHPPLVGQQNPNSVIGWCMWSLYVTVIDELCRIFNCNVNVLPQRLEECFGRILTPHGANLDSIPNVARYITRVKFHKRKLSREFLMIKFKGRRAYMRDRKHPTKWVPADSRKLGGVQPKAVDKARGKMMRPGHAGFALSMSRELYMARHRGSFPRDNFFHSSYLAGGTILCSGTIKIVNGEVREITDESGHYKPTPYHIINLLETLRMHGVDLGAIWVHCYCWPGWYTGDQVIAWRRGGAGLRERIAENRALIAQREGAMPAILMRNPPRPSTTVQNLLREALRMRRRRLLGFRD
ncbi:MAG: hypothetical protein GTO42_08640 [Candidatus Latescibacteria bacterium]|nr:hypothetical protein [Candidatus Latescibacterota bacterium]NIO29027.1 hypothetical protein [Candidatus Latescibacterota bacterium]NIO56652.1 hypothetical protein [Candidatus Latescibacterota bacterium]NIT02235.1 hypothetical protein [Candidatus Latescibacterota bacterium]NIT39120.1 hypothetical protein [Candidatus Latescibacterota bacterium]